MKSTTAMLLLYFSTTATVHAQSRWPPRYVDMGRTITGANRTTALERLEAIERLVKQVPELAHPNGFEIGSTFSGATKRSGQGQSAYYSVQVDEVPLAPPTRPDIQGIVVERWYERFSDGTPITSIKEGELVRVKMRVTVPADRQFVAVEDPLPAGLEPVDLRMRTSATLAPFVTTAQKESQRDGPIWQSWLYGNWDDGWWSPWEHKEIRDDRVVYFARMLWKGSYMATYVARATTAGSFVRPPAHAEEMYNPALQGRSDGGRFGVERVP